MTEENAIVKMTPGALDAGFGGDETIKPPIDVAWPEIKMSKTDKFEMAGKEPTEIQGHILFAQSVRAWWPEAFGKGGDTFPDCASSNAVAPDVGDNQQGPNCATCPKAQWVKVFENEDDKKGTNHQDCLRSTILMLLVNGHDVPYMLRVRSTSCGRKSSLAQFFGNCQNNGYALQKRFQTVEVKLTLEKTKLNGFDTSIMQVEKVRTLTLEDPKLIELTELFKRIKEEFEVSFVREQATQDDAGEPQDDTPFYPDPRTPPSAESTDDIPI